MDDFMRWLNAHYDTDDYVIREIAREGDDSRVVLLARCRRCGEGVGWLTRHAAERHGDEIQVIAPAGGAEAEVVAVY